MEPSIAQNFMVNEIEAKVGFGTRKVHAFNIPYSNVTSGSISFPNRGATCVSAGGLNRLILRSDKPETRPFQDWITDVVIPAIQKDGAYIMGEEKVASGEMDEDEFVLKAMAILQRKVERHKSRTEIH